MALDRKNCAILALLFFLTLFVYANSLRNPFVIDDQHIIVRNLLLRDWTVSKLVKSHLFAPLGVETQYYRPLTLLTFAINYSFSELNPFGYHLVNLALHFLVVILAYLLFSNWLSPGIAAFAAALFAVHPANVQAVSYISSRSDPLYTIFTLLVLFCWITGHESQGVRKVLLLILSLLSFFLALGAKEVAIVGPVLVVLTDLIWHSDTGWKKTLKQNWAWYLGFASVLAVYLVIRIGFAGYAVSMEASKEVWKEGTELGMGSRILLSLKLLGLYLGLTFYPVNLSFFRDVPIPQGPLESSVLLGITSLAFLIALAWMSWYRCRAASYGTLWFLISILPVLNLTSLNAPMMEHWLYLPLLGLTLAFSGCLYMLAERLKEARGAAIALAFVVILLSARTVARNSAWGNPILLFLQDAQLYPKQEKNWFLLAYAYFERGRADQAIRAYQIGLTVNPRHAYAWSGLGEAYSMVGKDEEAERSFLKAISIVPENPWLYYVLGITRLKAGKIDLAIESLNRAVSLTPPLPMAYHVLGSAYLRQGKKDEANAAFRKAMAILPRESEIHVATHVELGKLYMKQRDKNTAIEEWRLALQFDPNDREAKALLEGAAKETPAGSP